MKSQAGEQSSLLGGKGEEKGERKEGVKGQKEKGNLNAMKKEKGRKAVNEQELFLSSFIDLLSASQLFWGRF